MHTEHTPRNITPVSIQQVGTETLVYDERRHRAFCLNEISSAIWRLSDGEHTIAQIAAAASLQFQSPISDELVSFAIADLCTDGLIEPASTTALPPVLSRRAMLQRLGVGGAMLFPVVAAITAPTAAQAYSGCVDCSSQSIQSAHLARANRSKQLNALHGISDSHSAASTGAFSPYNGPARQPIAIAPRDRP